jgi:hypothetical protein
MPIEDDEVTPPYGIPPDELPTEPQLPHAMLPCPHCMGEGWVLAITERYTDGAFAKGLATPCPLCLTARKVTRAQMRSWLAVRQGRPEDDRTKPR